MYILLISLSFSTPLIVLIISLMLYKFPLQNINSFYGYRTTRSMKNIRAWNEANKYSSTLMIKFSFIVLLITAISLILVGKSYVRITIVTMTSTISTIFLLFIMIISTEKYLKNMS